MESVIEGELPLSKEERIRLALDFVRSQHSGDDRDVSSTMCENEDMVSGEGIHKDGKGYGRKQKHTIRQIAMYFQIPKSTLYDRMRADQGMKRQRSSKSGRISKQVTVDMDLYSTLTGNTGQTDVSKIYSHTSQMKFSPEMEEQLVNNIQGCALGYGNLPLISELRSGVAQINNAAVLGNKWINGFIKRHAEEVIYGSDTTNSDELSIKFGDFKQWANKFTHLHGIFVHLLRTRMMSCKRFQYIFKYVVRRPNCAARHILFLIDIRVPDDLSKNDLICTWLCEPLIRDFDGPEEFTASNSTSQAFLADIKKLLHFVPKDTDLVVLEGLTPLENWEWLQCLEIIFQFDLVGKLYTVPWGNQLLANAFNFNLDANVNQEFFTLANSPELRDLTAVSVLLHDLLTKHTISPPTITRRTTAKNSAASSRNSKEALDRLLRTISQNESRFYRELQAPDSRIALLDIFNQIRYYADTVQ